VDPSLNTRGEGEDDHIRTRKKETETHRRDWKRKNMKWEETHVVEGILDYQENKMA